MRPATKRLARHQRDLGSSRAPTGFRATAAELPLITLILLDVAVMSDFGDFTYVGIATLLAATACLILSIRISAPRGVTGRPRSLAIAAALTSLLNIANLRFADWAGFNISSAPRTCIVLALVASSLSPRPPHVYVKDGAPAFHFPSPPSHGRSHRHPLGPMGEWIL